MNFELWQNLNGNNPVAQFLETEIDKKTALKIAQHFENLEKHSVVQLLHTKQFKKVGRDLYSVRIKLNKICYRFLGTIRGSSFWLLHAFKKKSDKIPLKELALARQRAQELDYQLKNDTD